MSEVPWVQISAPVFTKHVILGKLVRFSELWIPYWLSHDIIHGVASWLRNLAALAEDSG